MSEDKAKLILEILKGCWDYDTNVPKYRIAFSELNKKQELEVAEIINQAQGMQIEKSPNTMRLR